jgi:benzylsuccinate CoA-transferase BbsF subunit
VLERAARIDEIEATVAAWTTSRPRLDVAEQLQAAGIEAVPIADFADLHDDPQLAHRGHWIRGEHPVLGQRWYERNGYRLPDDRGGFARAHAPLLGEDNAWLTREVFGLSDAERARLEQSGAIETPVTR